ncbi:MAG TPA: hypothetical protein VNT55_08000 [Baekduia sp.]|nr:hypothetical protein [Baekduia sp.]
MSLSVSLRPRVALLAAALAAAALGLGAPADGHPSPAHAAASPPKGFIRACGTIQIGKRSPRVDIAEGNGKLVTCAQARGVGRTFLRSHRSRKSFQQSGRKWSCYKSRPDGVGWDYNCLTLTGGYVDIGVGRRW